MSDMGDMWRAVKNASQDDRTQRLIRANAEFAQAKAMADEAGLELRQCTEAHYQLSALTAREARARVVSCPRCKRDAGQPCVSGDLNLIRAHSERMEAYGARSCVVY